MAIVLKEYSKTKYSGLKVHRDGDKFLFDVTIENKRFRKQFTASKALGKKDKMKQALKALEDFIETKTKQLAIAVDVDATVNDYYIALKASNGWSDQITNTYDGIYDKYIRGTIYNQDTKTRSKESIKSFGNKKIVDVVPRDFTKLNGTIKHLAKGSQKKLYDILIPLLNLAKEDEIIIVNPIKNSHIPKRNQLSEKKVIIDATTKYKALYKTLQQLFNSPDTIIFEDDTQHQCSINPHHLAIFLFGFHGRRLTETISLEWDDIDFNNNKYRIKGKTSKINTDMIFTLPSDIKEALLTFKNNTGPIFNIKDPKKYYKHIRKISGLDEFSFHWMRNLCVSALSTHGVSATELSAMLGHTDAGTLRKYLSLQRDTATAVTNEASQRLLS